VTDDINGDHGQDNASQDDRRVGGAVVMTTPLFVGVLPSANAV